MKSHNPGEYSAVLKSLSNLLSDPEENQEGQTVEEIKKELAEEGIDVDQMVSDVTSMIAKMQVERRLDAAREKRAVFDRLSKIKKGLCEKGNVKEELAKILQGFQPQLSAVYFRKLEEAKEEDLAAILEDLMLLEDEDDAAE